MMMLDHLISPSTYSDAEAFAASVIIIAASLVLTDLVVKGWRRGRRMVRRWRVRRMLDRSPQW